jgi:hypothetical protein
LAIPSARCNLSFPDMESLEKAEFLAPAPCLVDDEDRRQHRQAQRWLAIAVRDEELMRRWRAQFPSDVVDTRAQRRADRRRRRDIAERELVNPTTTWADDDDRWDVVWTETTSDDE